MKTFKILLTIGLMGLSSLMLTACKDAFDYDYQRPTVTVAPNSNSEAHYGAPATSDAHYGSRSNSDAHYGDEAPAPVPSVQVSPNNSSDAYYGH